MKHTPISHQITALIAPLVLAGGLAGCATHNTHTEGTLYMDTRKAVFATDSSAAPDCGSRRVVSTEVVTEPDVVVTPLTNSGLPTTPGALPRGLSPETGERRFSTAVERWTIERCGTQVRYLVTFMPAESGATDISVKPEG